MIQVGSTHELLDMIRKAERQKTVLELASVAIQEGEKQKCSFGVIYLNAKIGGFLVPEKNDAD